MYFIGYFAHTAIKGSLCDAILQRSFLHAPSTTCKYPFHPREIHGGTVFHPMGITGTLFHPDDRGILVLSGGGGGYAVTSVRAKDHNKWVGLISVSSSRGAGGSPICSILHQNSEKFEKHLSAIPTERQTGFPLFLSNQIPWFFPDFLRFFPDFFLIFTKTF